MLDQLQALAALRELGTMGRAAARLRITQSAVSKRVAALEASVGAALTERVGRKIRLTAHAESLLGRALPLLIELEQVLRAPKEQQVARLSIGVSESLMASWAPALLRRVTREIPGLELELHAHRSPVAVEQVRAGLYPLALCADPLRAPDLAVVAIAEEPMVVIPSGGRRLREAARSRNDLPVLTIEPRSATWASLRGRLEHLARAGGRRVQVVGVFESFTAVAQMAAAGFGHGLVPIGVAQALGLHAQPVPRLTRTISLMGRATTLERPLVDQLIGRLRSETPKAWKS